jgi:hypothetical protein
VRKNRVRRRASGSGCEMAWWRPRRQRWRSEAKLRAESNAGLRPGKSEQEGGQRGSKRLKRVCQRGDAPRGEAQGQGSGERRAARCGAVRCMHACPSSRSERFERHEECVFRSGLFCSRVGLASHGRADGGSTTDGAGRVMAPVGRPDANRLNPTCRSAL